ncbi:MAG: aminoacyl-tRNA hydrolase [Deltaproteobacteria bacterium]|nr:aminoacyl-tRNA hydrolase [Deltaproteobacteria bacterium]
MWLIAGLGNPGPKYEGTRHNLGFWALELISRRWGIPFARHSGFIDQGQGRYGTEDILLVKPLEYMNRSGEVLEPLVRREGIEMNRIVVIFDDMDLPLGTVRFKKRGGSGGHRGMDSIIRRLGSEDIKRIRLGIGRPGNTGENVDYVLSKVTRKESPVVGRMLETAADLAERAISEGEMDTVTMNLTEAEEEL